MPRPDVKLPRLYFLGASPRRKLQRAMRYLQHRASLIATTTSYHFLRFYQLPCALSRHEQQRSEYHYFSPEPRSSALASPDILLFHFTHRI